MAALSLLDFLHALGYEQDIVKSIAQQADVCYNSMQRL